MAYPGFPAATWVSTHTYNNSTDAWANYQGVDYVSSSASNTGNIPPNTPGSWALMTSWIGGTAYIAGDKVTYNGLGYVSLAGSNTGHIPSSTTGVWWDRLVVKSVWSPPPNAGSRVKFRATVTFMPGPRDGVNYLFQAGSPALGGHIGATFYRMFPSSPTSAPGPNSVWIGHIVFRVLKPGYFFGLGQRANQSPVMHNSGE